MADTGTIEAPEFSSSSPFTAVDNFEHVCLCDSKPLHFQNKKVIFKRFLEVFGLFFLFFENLRKMIERGLRDICGKA